MSAWFLDSKLSTCNGRDWSLLLFKNVIFLIFIALLINSYAVNICPPGAYLQLIKAFCVGPN